MRRSGSFLSGMRDGIPVCLGYIAVSFTFGLKAVRLGLSPWDALIFSVANVTSAGQFAGLEMIAYSAPLLEIVFAQLVINLRYSLMSATIASKIHSKTGLLSRLLMAYGMTDEIFALSATRSGTLDPFYTYGLISVAIPGWAVGTLGGALLGEILPEAVLSALGVAIYGMFLAIIIPPARKFVHVRAVVLIAMALSALMTWLPALNGISSGFRIIIIAVLVSVAAALLRPVEDGHEATSEPVSED